MWSVDGCGNLEDKVDECGHHVCRDATCEVDDEPPCLEREEGRCDGDRVRLCHAGRALTVDCAQQGLRCAYGDEGAECLPKVPKNERCTGEPYCVGDVLVQCVAGRALKVDCAAQRASCAELPDAAFAGCVTRVPDPTSLARGCGPCGCQSSDEGEAACDGRDEDGDGFVDEGLDCGPVPVVAFIVTDGAGQSNHAPEDVQAELTYLNELFTQSAPQNTFKFELAELVSLADSTLLELDEDELQRLIHDPRVRPSRETFYLPLVFTDVVSHGGSTPKSGVSTLPNGTCGGLQESVGPELGLVVVSKGRSPTTVAHEIGHFLGLCHTHDQRIGAPRLLNGGPTSEAVACEPSCRGEGDGLCDTPLDPGPEQCLYDAMCQTRCAEGDEPDATNLMGYYTMCRTRFSEEQVRLMQHTLALRRAWHPCFEHACACELGADACPVGMSCRLVTAAGEAARTQCGLDGPRAPGADCNDGRECGQGALCIAERNSALQRCVRPCLSSLPGCSCTAMSSDSDDVPSVCIEDLTVSAPR